MRSITAVEISADACALASTQVLRGGDLRVTATETLDPAAFPGIEAFTLALQKARRSLKLPRRCRAVVWGLPDGATRNDPGVQPLVEPLTRAGFKVTRVVTPCNALGALSRLRTSRTGGAMCWLGINRNGVAIVVIRPGKLLYSHSFPWDSSIGATGSQARLLQRYSLVAHLAPEVRRALAAARQKGTTVDGIVTCGNLPDLRSLTMPLIEELDIEVETLDSLEGLVVKPALADRLSERASAIRLACAGAFARETRAVDESVRRRVRRGPLTVGLGAAAALAALGLAAYLYYTWTRPGPDVRHPITAPAAPKPNPVAASTPKSTPAAATPSAVPPSAVLRPPSSVPRPSSTTTTTTMKPTPAAATPPAAPPSAVFRPAPSVPRPPSTTTSTPAAATPSAAPPLAAPRPPPSVSRPSSTTTTTTKSTPAAPTPPAAVPPSSVLRPPPSVLRPAPSVPHPSTPAAGRGLNPQPSPADKPDATTAGRRGARELPPLLKDPVPRVSAILVSPERRFATIGDEGRIIAIGDSVGRRVVVAIDERAVVFREPSGVQIRVAPGGHIVGVEMIDRRL